MPGTFVTVPQWSAIIERTVGSPNLSFREIKISGTFETVLENTRELRFEAMEFQVIRLSIASLMDEEHTLGTKWTQLQTN